MILKSWRISRSGFEQRGDDGLVGEGGSVADVGVVDGDFPEDAAHDFARTGFGESRRVMDDVGAGERADFLSDWNWKNLGEMVNRPKNLTGKGGGVESGNFG